MIIPNIPDHRSVNFIEDQVVHILGFASYLISVAITHQAFVALRQPYTISKHKSIFEFQLNFIYGHQNFNFISFSCVTNDYFCFLFFYLTFKNVKITLSLWTIEKLFVRQIGPKHCSFLSGKIIMLVKHRSMVGKLSRVFY